MPRRLITAEALASIPGFEADLSGNGHYFDSPKGRCFLWGVMPGDECFDRERWGQINISRCYDAFSGEGDTQPMTTPLNAGIVENISKNDFDQRWVDLMTIERRDEPVLMMVGSDGLNVVDGTHRVRRRLQDSCTHISFYLLHPRVMQMARVRLMREQSDGSWLQDGGVSDDDLEREVAAAEAMLRDPSKLGLRYDGS